MGKSYVTTKPPFDHLRGLCTFPTTKFFLYELSQMSSLAMAFHNDLLVSIGSGDVIAGGLANGSAQQQPATASNSVTNEATALNELRLEVAKVHFALLMYTP